MIALNLLYIFSPIVSVGLEIAIVILLALILKALRHPVAQTKDENAASLETPAVLPAEISNPTVASKDAEIAAAIAIALDMSKK